MVALIEPTTFISASAMTVSKTNTYVNLMRKKQKSLETEMARETGKQEYMFCCRELIVSIKPRDLSYKLSTKEDMR